MLLLIDNYDSFTYNLVQYLRQLTAQVEVYANDTISISDILHKKPQHIMISPGPGRPTDAGISIDLIKKFAGKVPILGVCLGHQAIAAAFGGRIVRAGRILHGKTSSIYHSQQGLFANLASPFMATRYHSLLIEPQSLPEEFQVTAWTQTEQGELNEIMAIQHKTLPLYGVQFHPESILTEHGMELLARFLTTSIACV